MNIVVNSAALALGVLLLVTPLLNRHVFKTINVDEIVLAGREGVNRVQDLQQEGRFLEAIDSCNALIGRFSNDSTQFVTADVVDWEQVRDIVLGTAPHPWEQVFLGDLDDEDRALVDEKEPLPLPVREVVVRSLNYLVNDDGFYADNRERFDLAAHPDLAARLDALLQDGVLTGEGVGEKISPSQRAALRRFHVLLVENLVFPAVVHKDMRRGTDWASEFIVQTAMYYAGVSYRAQFQLDQAVEVWNELIERFPRSIYAEVLFLQMGQALSEEGRMRLADNERGVAELRFREAVEWLERLERNREIAAEFPKYQFADLEPGRYVNVDRASRARTRIRQRTELYTREKARQELEGRSSEDRSGYYLEDAIKLIGECYISLGLTDSARMQFNLILDFFPDSDNLDNAQMLIADSWVREGELLLAGVDTLDPGARAPAMSAWHTAVNAYLSFINTFPQSGLVPEVFIKLGDVYNKLGDTDASARAFASALGRAKDAEEQARVQLRIGNYFYDRDRYAEAIDNYQIILNNFLATEVAPNAQYMLGECHMSMGDTLEAIRNFEVILEHYRSSSFMGGAAFKIGDYYLRQSNYKEARRAFSMGWQYDRNGNLAGQTKFQLGVIWVRIAEEAQDEAQRDGAYEEAVREFSVLVRDFAGTEIGEQASYQIARSYVAMGREDAAREATRNIVVNRDLLLRSVKLFTSGEGDNFEEDVRYWAQAYEEALDDEERSTALYEKGMVLSDRLSRFEEAVAVFERSLALTTRNSKRISTTVGLAKAHAGRDAFNEAESLYVELIENPRVGEDLRLTLRIQLYDVYFRARRWDEASDGFERFFTEHPAHSLAPYALYRTGSVLVERKEYARAIDLFQRILDNYSSSNMYDKAVLAIAEQKLALGNPREMVDYLEAFIEKHQDDESVTVLPNMYMKIAEAQADHLDQKRRAITTYERILADDDETNRFFSFAAYRQGVVYRDLGEEAHAVAAFELVRRDDRSIYRGAQAEIGKLLARTEPERAIEHYRRIVEVSDTQEDSVISLIGIGDVYHTIRQWDEAARSYQEAYDFYTGNDTNLIAGALVKRVDALINGKRNREAIDVARTMQERFPDHPLTINTYYFESAALFALERYAAAREVMQKIVELDQNEQLTEIATYQIADSWFFTKNHVMAIQKYEEYRRRYPKGRFVARALYMQATCYISMSEPDYERARQRFQEVVGNHPGFDEMCNAKNYLAYCMDRTGDWRSALRYYREVMNDAACSARAREFAREQHEAVTVKNM